MPAPTLTAPLSQAVEHDWPCMKCGYNLRTIATDGICPECAAKVQETLAARPLWQADRSWVRRKALGILYPAIVLSLILVGWDFLVRRTNLAYRWSPIITRREIELLPWILMTFPAALLLLRPETPDDRKTWPGRLLMIVVIGHLVCGIGVFLQRFFFPKTYSIIPLQPAIPFFYPAEFWALLLAAESLCLRIPTAPMTFEIRWLRRLLFMTMYISAAIDLLVWFVAVVRFPSPVGSYVLGDFWGPIAAVVRMATQFLTIALLCYLPLHLLRVYLHLRKTWIDAPERVHEDVRSEMQQPPEPL